jgi:hypothetical protein
VAFAFKAQSLLERFAGPIGSGELSYLAVECPPVIHNQES